MINLQDQAKELLRRAELTTKARYGAADRLERHHKLSQWTVSSISTALVFIPIMQALKVNLGTEVIYLSAIQAILAILVLVYSLLLGQENFISRSEAMQRNGLELGKFSRKLDGSILNISQYQYEKINEEYYSILSKYPNHKPIDYLLTKLSANPTDAKSCARYIYHWVKWVTITCLIFSHYILAISFVAYILFSLAKAITA
ncbi:SLATT domain-containing protein [Xanthomonas sp. WHRI 10064A]|uniref:SLATT domain-containing protein n=1 Tax=unclassified Xanthomonas TaxID=2643310 RepID=UPI002B222DC6|nr:MULTISPECIES: SLATT domain-containing protein [unclassified Xanthomonas]MEA9588668.1 SLATT domain-containing protein [Xanthomonas sp. WHRI 10064B]MEA9613653.1 SLATT domain-containing protein [Xanthomonas sp. WHRI 10064A]